MCARNGPRTAEHRDRDFKGSKTTNPLLKHRQAVAPYVFYFTTLLFLLTLICYQYQGVVESMNRKLVAIVTLAISTSVSAAPPGFPGSGNGLWYTTPATIWSRQYLPIGNGYLAAMTPGGTTQEATQLNIESLWSGGPFADPVHSHLSFKYNRVSYSAM